MSQAQTRHGCEAGFALLRQGRIEEAQRLAGALLAEHPGDPAVLALSTEVALAFGDGARALQHADALAALRPGDPLPQLRRARALLQQRRRRGACAAAEAAVQKAGANGQVLWSAGKVHAACNDALTARGLFERALAAGFTTPALRYDLATAQMFTADFDAAEAQLEAMLTTAPDAGHAIHLRSTLRRQTPDRNHIDDIQSRLRDGRLDPAGQAAALYALAKELEDLGEDARAFETLSRGAAAKRSTLHYDVAAEIATLDAMAAAWTPEAMAATSPGHDGEGAIFIVGLPRTGTTLLERMLGRHPEVGSAGELMDFAQALGAAARNAQQRHPGLGLVEASLRMDFAALGRDYLAGAREAAPPRPRFIDKMPVNFLYCGMIHRALPRARILHLVRDPMDACHAIYKTLFNQAYHFSYDLAELGAYYLAYRRLMAHWHQAMPGQILDVRYEELVSDTELQARRVLDFCDLPWDPAVLSPDANDSPATTASAAQVRQPIHRSSVGRWRRHREGLAPLVRLLADAGIAVE